MDSDVVTLRDPFPILRKQLAPQDTMVLASVDGRFPDEDPHECERAYSHEQRWGRSAAQWKLCGGFFYLQSSRAALQFLRDWERRLQGPDAGAKNQPHYNAALRAVAPSLRVEVMACDLFPNGYRYSSTRWRAAQNRTPIAVHANWIKGSTLKQQHLRSRGLWRTSFTSRAMNDSTK